LPWSVADEPIPLPEDPVRRGRLVVPPHDIGLRVTRGRLVQRLLVALGLLLVAAGLLWPSLSRLPWGRLPGDISIEREGYGFHFPLMTSLLVSVAASLLLWWLWRK